MLDWMKECEKGQTKKDKPITTEAAAAAAAAADPVLKRFPELFYSKSTMFFF